jgi:hypothetical protein
MSRLAKYDLLIKLISTVGQWRIISEALFVCLKIVWLLHLLTEHETMEKIFTEIYVNK